MERQGSMSKCVFSKQAYRVKDSEPAIVGVLVLDREKLITKKHGSQFGGFCYDDTEVLLAHSHTREPEFVLWGDLIEYGPPGGEAMPQPKVEGGK